MSEPTPMMRQYLEIKERHHDKIVFFRLGDFYEMFRNDALVASQILGLTLTHRQAEPMCGVPYHSAATYIRKLLDAGRCIAICEQVTLPGADKGLVRREVVDILTPGSLVEDGYLPGGGSNLTMALAFEGDLCSLAAADLSTGLMRATHFQLRGRLEPLERELGRFSPRELLIADDAMDKYPFLGDMLSRFKPSVVTQLPHWRFEKKSAYRRLLEHFGVSSLYAFGLDPGSAESSPLGVLLEYWQLNSPGRSLSHINSVMVYSAEDFLQIDPQSARSLEIVTNNRDGGPQQTLLSVLDSTKTAPGARLLRTRLLFPLVDRELLEHRLDQVEAFVSAPQFLAGMRENLGRLVDVERLCARLALDKASPRDLLGFESSVQIASELVRRISDQSALLLPQEWGSDSQERLKEWMKESGKLLHRNPPQNSNEGGLVADHFREDLDQLRHLRDHSQDVLEAYLLEEQRACGLPQLRIRFNKIIGYYFEVTKSKLDSLPSHFHRKQSLVGSERFTTPRLVEIEEMLLHAQDRIIELERSIFLDFRNRSKDYLKDFQDMVAWTSALDVSATLAHAAVVHRYVRPSFSAEEGLHLEAARHPVVEAALQNAPFVPNSLYIGPDDRLFLITGPNMAGKSTYLRQSALVVLLGQIGSFVPADSAHWSLVDRIFCRVGASDHLARGESTFLVEMNETAYILRNATPRSLVIMDEVGRGTSTRDGFSLAWAICEHLLEAVKAKTLFATHFHELTALSHPAIRNFSMAVLEQGDEVVFLRRIVPGAADNSYGLHVASLAGVPASVVARASQILNHLPPEDQTAVPEKGSSRAVSESQLSLFDLEDPLRAELLGLNIDQITPLQALQILDRWKQQLTHRS